MNRNLQMRTLLSTITIAFVATFITISCTESAQAWSRHGHEISSYLAEKELLPEVAEQINEILDGDSMASVSTWADRIRRDRPETFPFHFVNGPRGVLESREEDYMLPQGNVYTAILGYSELLTDDSLTPNQRREALAFLIHFIQDLHQPLHCGFADDMGANSVPVIFEERELNLHRIWDNEILGFYRDISAKEAAQAMWEKYTDEDRAEWVSMGNPRDWVVEARKPIFAGLYPPPRTDIPGHEEPIVLIDELYIEIWLPVAEIQIARSGSRLAATLNAIFTTGASPFDPLTLELPLLPEEESELITN